MKNNELTPSRVLGKICKKHPKLKGLRRRARGGCVECEREKLKIEYYAKHKDRLKYHKERRETLKDSFISAMGGRCQLCGNSDKEVLTVDHINGDGNKNGRKRRGGSDSRAEYRRGIKEGPTSTTIRLLCMNCNFKAYLHLKRTGAPLFIRPDYIPIKAIQRDITEWANQQFPQRTATGALIKLVLDEIPELLHGGLDSPGEWADIIILGLDIASLRGIDVQKAIEDKMNINKKRKWSFNTVTGTAQHVD